MTSLITVSTAGVKEVLLAVVIRRSRNNNKVRIAVGEFGIQRCGQIQLLLCQILFNILILNRGFPAVDQFHFFRDDIYGVNLMVLRQQCGNTQANITSASNCNRVISSSVFSLSVLARSRTSVKPGMFYLWLIAVVVTLL